MNFVSYQQLCEDIIEWAKSLPRDFDLIVGISRSGLLPAILLSLHLNLPISEVEAFRNGHIFEPGQRGKTPEKINKILVIDDTVLSGKTIRKVKNQLKDKECSIKYAAVYSGKDTSHVDYFFKIIPILRCFQWNIMHANLLTNSCMDIDGVLCDPPTDKENDDGEQYIKFLENTKPLYIPTVKIKYLVTCRLERYRDLTEKWLKQHNVKYDNLIMMDYPTKEARVKAGRHASYKAENYTQFNTELFIEDSPAQAEEISRITHKPVLCVGNWIMYEEKGLKVEII